MSRRSKLNKERQARLCEALRAGNTRAAAAEYAGIGTSTLYRWLDRGEAQQRGAYRDFWDAVKKAEADAEVRNVALIQRAANGGTWQAAAWWLERRRPSQWALKRNETPRDTSSDDDSFDVDDASKVIDAARRELKRKGFKVIT